MASHIQDVLEQESGSNEIVIYWSALDDNTDSFGQNCLIFLIDHVVATESVILDNGGMRRRKDLKRLDMLGSSFLVVRWSRACG